MFKQTDLLVASKEKQQIRPEPQLQIHPKHWFLRSSEGMIQWSKILITSNHYHQLHIRHGEALVPPLKTKNHGTKSPGSQVGMENDERTPTGPTPSRTQNTPQKKESSANHVMICSLRASLWRREGLASRALGMPFVNTQANPLPISTHRGMKQSCSDFMIFKILKDIIFQQNGWGRMPWPQFKVGWKANIRVALNTGWRDDPGSHTSGRRKLHGLEGACWVIGDIGEQQAPNGSQLFNLGKSNIVRDSEIFRHRAAARSEISTSTWAIKPN